MSEDKKDFEGLGKLLDHNYDNIRELDNPLPGWWLVTFWATIAFSVCYYSYYQFFGGPTQEAELQAALQELKSQSAAQSDSGKAVGEVQKVDLVSLLGKPEVLASGKAVFASKCFACHGMNGEGQIGPNLTDDYWIHGDGSLDAIKTSVAKGVLEKGMPAWEAAVSPDELNAVVVYVKSIYGSKPANAKAPQGEKVELKN